MKTPERFIGGQPEQKLLNLSSTFRLEQHFAADPYAPNLIFELPSDTEEESHTAEIGDSPLDYEIGRYSRLEDEHSNKTTIEFRVARSAEGLQDQLLPGELVDRLGFRYPIYSISKTTDRNVPYTDTPYGAQRSIARGEDQALYEFRDTFFFDNFGKGIKLEDIRPLWGIGDDGEYYEETPEGLSKDGYDTSKIGSLDFIPDPKDSWFVGISDFDYEWIDELFDNLGKHKLLEYDYGVLAPEEEAII